MPKVSYGHSDAAGGAAMAAKEFARRLNRMLAMRGWNQSELGRRSNIARDLISNYTRARNLPTPANLLALAQALGVEPNDLMPMAPEPAASQDESQVLVFRELPDGRRVWIEVRRIVSRQTAARIVTILYEDNRNVED